MDERLAVVFEVYRYAVCWFCIVLFLILGFMLIMGALTAQNATGVAAYGGGILLCLALFILHWRLKNPHI